MTIALQRCAAGLLLSFVVLLLGTACGGGTTSASEPTGLSAGAAAGKQTFADAGCGSCHTFAAAGSNGAFGPNLDESDVSFRDAYAQIRDGGGGMPSFEDRLTPGEIANVARFVVTARAS